MIWILCNSTIVNGWNMMKRSLCRTDSKAKMQAAGLAALHRSSSLRQALAEYPTMPNHLHTWAPGSSFFQHVLSNQPSSEFDTDILLTHVYSSWQALWNAISNHTVGWYYEPMYCSIKDAPGAVIESKLHSRILVAMLRDVGVAVGQGHPRRHVSPNCGGSSTHLGWNKQLRWACIPQRVAQCDPQTWQPKSKEKSVEAFCGIFSVFAFPLMTEKELIHDAGDICEATSLCVCIWLYLRATFVLCFLNIFSWEKLLMQMDWGGWPKNCFLWPCRLQSGLEPCLSDR